MGTVFVACLYIDTRESCGYLLNVSLTGILNSVWNKWILEENPADTFSLKNKFSNKSDLLFLYYLTTKNGFIRTIYHA